MSQFTSQKSGTETPGSHPTAERISTAAPCVQVEAVRPPRGPIAWKTALGFTLLFLLGAGLRSIELPRPINQTDWRECDLAAIARNFDLEGMNILYPRIDWRGDGPGYAEMEFPLYSWTIAALYRVFGVHETLCRVVSYVASLLSLAVFFRLACDRLQPVGAWAASSFFTLSPLAIKLATSLHAEAFMLPFLLMAVLFFLRWLDHGRWLDYGLAIASTAMAILAKSPAVHLGILFAVLVLRHQGWKAIKQPAIWCFAVLSLLPGVLWYSHAYQLWLTYGNSLGVSNEAHSAGRFLFTDPKYIRGILRLELEHVWTLSGLVVAVIGLVWARGRSRDGRIFILAWLLALGIFYLATAKTTAGNWAYYYHISSLPVAALSFGLGFDAVLGLDADRRIVGKLTAALGVLAVICLIVGLVLSFSGISLAKWGWRGAVVCVLAATLTWVLEQVRSRTRTNQDSSRVPRPLGAILTLVVAIGAVATASLQVRAVRWWSESLEPSSIYLQAKQLREMLTEPGLIVASGLYEVDEQGFPVAINTPYLFYWTDRQGFNNSWQSQSVPELRQFSKRGARYFAAERKALEKKPGFESEVRGAFPVIAETQDLVLFKIHE